MASAKNIKGITIEIEGKTSGLVKALDEANKSLSKTKSALNDVNAALKLDPGNADLIRQKQALLADAIDETKKKLEAEKQAAKDAADALARGDISQEQYATLQADIAKTTKELESLEKQAKKSASVLGQQFEETGKKISAVGDKVTSVGNALAPISGAAVAGFTAAVKTTADFEAQMSRVEALSGSTEEQMEALEKKAREMGATTKFSATEAGEAFEYMALAGWKADDMAAGISGIMSLAAASGEDLATVSDIVTDALTAFGNSAEDAGHFADVLAAASSNSNTTVSMMGEAFKYVAPLAGSLGYSVDDVAVALGLMANSGVKASTAGTSLRSILSNLVDPSKEVTALMEQMGVSLDDGQGNMLPFMDILTQLREGFGDMKIPMDEFIAESERLEAALDAGEITAAEYEITMSDLTDRAYGAEGALKAEAASAIAGQRGLSALLAMVNASDEDFAKLTSAIDGADGAAENMAEIMQDNLAGQLQILVSQLQELAISIGEILMPTIMKVVDGIQGFVDWLNSLDEGTKEIIVQIGLFVAALAPVLIVVGKVISVIGTITSAIGSIMPVISTVGAVITGTVLPAIGSVIVAIAPFLAIAAAVVAAVVGIIEIVKHWDEITAWFSEKWGQFSEWISGKWEETKENVSAGWEALKTGAKEKWSNIKETVTGVMQNLDEKTGGVLSSMAQAWKDNGGGIQGTVAAWKAGVTTHFTNLFNTLNEKTGGQLGELAKKFKEKFEDIKGKVKDAFSDMIKNALNWGKDLIANFVSGITDKIQAVKDAVGKVANTVKDFLGFSEPEKGPLSNFHTFAPDMVDLFAQGISDNLGVVQGAVGQMSQTVAAGVDYSGQLNEINNSVTALGAGSGQPLVANINIGGERLDTLVMNAIQRSNYLSGGR